MVPLWSPKDGSLSTSDDLSWSKVVGLIQTVDTVHSGSYLIHG